MYKYECNAVKMLKNYDDNNKIVHLVKHNSQWKIENNIRINE